MYPLVWKPSGSLVTKFTLVQWSLQKSSAWCKMIRVRTIHLSRATVLWKTYLLYAWHVPCLYFEGEPRWLVSVRTRLRPLFRRGRHGDRCSGSHRQRFRSPPVKRSCRADQQEQRNQRLWRRSTRPKVSFPHGAFFYLLVYSNIFPFPDQSGCASFSRVFMPRLWNAEVESELAAGDVHRESSCLCVLFFFRRLSKR